VPKVHFLVEGQTEEIVVRDVIEPSFARFDDVYLSSSLFITKRPAVGPARRGGIVGWARLQRELKRLLGDSSITVLTTLFDYYAFPRDAPGMSDRPLGSPYDRVRHVEKAIAKVINDGRFLPHLTLHEIETWVLADCARLGEAMGDPTGAVELLQVVDQKSSPELIDDGPATAPSKRILNAFPTFKKTIDGPLVMADIGLESIRRCCPHANDWLTEIETRISKPENF
jgi:Domain of unknown function (DUF4276)